MVKRNVDGSLKVIGKLPLDTWLRGGSVALRKAWAEEARRLNRELTTEERKAIRQQFTQ